MNDRFYDFDKDDSFDEVYLEKTKKKPAKKEYEIEIPMPRSGIKSTMPKKASEPPRKKVSGFAKTLSVIGIVTTCFITFVGSFVGVVFGWKYLPSFTEQEDSHINDVEKSDEVIQVSDDGYVVDVVPFFEEPIDTSTPAPTEEPDETEGEGNSNEETEGNSEDGESETEDENSSEESPSPTPESSGTDDEIINID